jgi:hypothetical protein
MNCTMFNLKLTTTVYKTMTFLPIFGGKRRITCAMYIESVLARRYAYFCTPSV